MRKFVQNKLWRDKAPSLMEDTGSVIHIKTLTDEEYNDCLKDKLEEEAAEVKNASTKKELLEEIADVLEVIDAICKFHNISSQVLEECKQKKYLERGGFYNRKFVTFAEHGPNTFGEKYCLDQPEKYPEIIGG